MRRYSNFFCSVFSVTVSPSSSKMSCRTFSQIIPESLLRKYYFPKIQKGSWWPVKKIIKWMVKSSTEV